MGDMADYFINRQIDKSLFPNLDRNEKAETALVEYKSIKCLTDQAIRFRIIEDKNDFEIWVPKKLCWQLNRKKKTFETPLKFYEDKMLEALKNG